MTNLAQINKSNEAELTPKIREQAKAMLAERPELTQLSMANQTGVGKAVLSLWLNDNYTGDNLKVTNKVAIWLDKNAEAERMAGEIYVPEDPPYYATPTGDNIIWPMLQYSQMRGSLALIYGGAGVCKTSTFCEYERVMPNVWRVQCTPATRGLGAFLSVAATTMGVTCISSKPAIVEQAIADKLTGCKGLLIVDDAQYLPVDTLYEIVWLRERAGVGILISGNESIHGRMQAGFAQLYSRVGKRKKLSRIVRGDLKASLAAWERHQSLPTGILSGKVEDFFWGNGDGKLGPARQDGGLRNVSEAMALAIFISRGADEALELKHIRAAWADISGTANEKKGGA